MGETMTATNMIDFEQELAFLCEAGRIAEAERVQIAVTNAADIIMRGLRHFIGDGAQWLPEYDKVASWLTDNHGRGLLCMGNVGRGKSVLCGRVLPCIIHYWGCRIVTYYTARELAANYDEAARRRLLCIDDIGVETAAMVYGTRIEAVPAIIDEAERRGALLLLTTNMNMDELVAKYGERTVDRLRGLCEIVIFRGGSLRGRAKDC